MRASQQYHREEEKVLKEASIPGESALARQTLLPVPDVRFSQRSIQTSQKPSENCPDTANQDLRLQTEIFWIEERIIKKESINLLMIMPRN